MGQPKAPDLWDMGPSHHHEREDSDAKQRSSASMESLYNKQRSTEKLYSLSETKTKSNDNLYKDARHRSSDKLYDKNKSVESLNKVAGSTSSQTDGPGFDEEGNITFIGADGTVLDITGDLNTTIQRPKPQYQEGCWLVKNISLAYVS